MLQMPLATMNNLPPEDSLQSVACTHGLTGEGAKSLELQTVLNVLNQKFPICYPSVKDAIGTSPEWFAEIGVLALRSLAHCFPGKTLEQHIEDYAEFTVEQNRYQRNYDKTGTYPCRNHASANDAFYQNDASMSRYMAAMLLTQFLWPHHLDILSYYIEQFVKKSAAENLTILEMAPGHGLLGRLLLEQCPGSSFIGVDISPFAVALSSRMMAMPPAVLGAEYKVGDALGIDTHHACDLIIAGEVLEHLDAPEELLAAVKRCLAPNGRAFLTAAITAAQMDHVTEFRSPEEVETLIRKHGFEIESAKVAQPRATRPGSTRIPRVMAAIVRHSPHE